jgi:hypothetical protein
MLVSIFEDPVMSHEVFKTKNVPWSPDGYVNLDKMDGFYDLKELLVKIQEQ